MRLEDVDTDPYANAVLRALVGDFPQLRDFTVANVVRRNLYAHHHTNRGRGLEIIVDNPISANWRLIAAPKPGRVQLACWRTNLTGADQERLDRLNEALSQIPEAPDEHPLRPKASRHR